MNKKFLLSHMLSMLPTSSYTLVGNDVEVQNLATPDTATETSLIWISPERNIANIANHTRAKAIVCQFFESFKEFPNKSFIFTPNPKQLFTEIGNRFFLQAKSVSGIHPTAIVDPNAKIHPSAYIGPYCVIGKVCIGENSQLVSQISCQDDVIIGKNVLIHTGVRIGAEGLGHIRNTHNEWVNFPHVGQVIIEDDVEIGANTTIAKGALCNTVIGKGTKIDCQVHIAHNVIIGKRTLIVAGTVLGGSSQIGDDVFLGMNASIIDRINIGNNTHIGPGAVVIKSVAAGEQLFARAAMRMTKIE